MRRVRTPAFPRATAGMTLVEMVLVIALIALVTAVTAAALTGGVAGMQLRSATKDIATALRHTRTQAIASGEPKRFELDPEAHRWQAPGGKHGEIDAAIAIAITGARQAQPSRGVGGVQFFEDGASTGGRVQLSRDSQVWNIDIAWMTGAVRVSRASAP